MSERRGASALVVIAGGRAIEGDEARAIWVRFSAHMDEHQGDMDGFARAEGWVAARTEHRAGRAVLVLSSSPFPPTPVTPPVPSRPSPARGVKSGPPKSRAPSRRRRPR